MIFEDGSLYSATQPNAPPLLTINVPIGLQLGDNPGNLVVRAGELIPAAPSLTLAIDRTVAFVGGNVLFDGAQIRSPQSRIELGAVGANGFVRLTPANNGFMLGYDGSPSFQDIQLVGGTTIDVSGDGGGAIQFQGRQIEIADGSQVISTTEGTQPGGNIFLRGSESVALSGTNLERFTAVASETVGSGAGGDLTVETGQFSLWGTAFLSTSTSGTGTGGNLTLRASRGAVLVGSGSTAVENYISRAFLGILSPSDRIGGLFAATEGGGRGGNLAIETDSLSLHNGVIVVTPILGSAPGGNINLRATETLESFGSVILTIPLFRSQGAAGQINLTADQLTIKESSLVSSVTFGGGPAGDINLVASDWIEISDTRTDALFPTGITNNSFGAGAGGNIRISTGKLFNRGGAFINANSGGDIGTGIILPGGPGGDIEIEARESIEISGTALFDRAQDDGVVTSGPSTTTFTAFPAGNLTLRAPRLRVADGGLVSSATVSAGDGGNLIIEAESVEVTGRATLDGTPSLLVTSSGRADFPQLVATGKGGNFTMNTGELIVGDGAELDVRSFGPGDAGTLAVRANSIHLDRGSILNASTVSGRGGNLVLDAAEIELRRGSRLSTDAGNTDGGNISINTETLVALENSDITANAIQGSGGQVTIAAQGIFGTAFREALTPESDITATSDLGEDFSGTVKLTTPDVDASLGLVELQSNTTDKGDLVVSTCGAVAGSSFTITGRGGLPESPTETLRSAILWEDVRNLVEYPEENPEFVQNPQLVEPEPTRELVEATGWIVREDGTVELVASNDRSRSSWSQTPSCHEGSNVTHSYN